VPPKSGQMLLLHNLFAILQIYLVRFGRFGVWGAQGSEFGKSNFLAKSFGSQIWDFCQKGPQARSFWRVPQMYSSNLRILGIRPLRLVVLVGSWQKGAGSRSSFWGTWVWAPRARSFPFGLEIQHGNFSGPKGPDPSLAISLRSFF